MGDFKTYNVYADGATYTVGARNEEEAKKPVYDYLMDTQGETEEPQDTWAVEEVLQPITIIYDEFDDNGEQIKIPSDKLAECLSEPEILGCDEWM